MIDGLSRNQVKAGRLPRLAAALSTVLVLGACAQSGGSDLLNLSSLGQEPPAADLRDPIKATNYYAKQYATNPRDKTTALNYAHALTETGQKSRALAVLRAAAAYHGKDPAFASAYGRSALANGHVGLASKLLARADDPSNPDWRTVSARGAAFARNGKYQEATTEFERAMKLAPGNATVMNNLAMANAATGDLKRAETLLRQASLMPMAKQKVRQNLALVLRLQGRAAEAAKVQSGPPTALRSAVAPTASTKPSATQKVALLKTETKTKTKTQTQTK